MGIVAYDGMTLLDMAGPVEVLSEAGHYDVTLFSPSGGPVRTSSGVRVAVDSPVPQRGFDTLLVPGGDGPPVRDPALVRVVRDLAPTCGRIASICTGSFLLAEAGLLDGRAATTHWKYAELLRRGYPAVTVEPDAIFVRAGTVFTSAGVSAGIDLALALVEDDHGAAVAREVARSLVVFMRRPGGQSQFSARLELPTVPAGPLRLVLDAVAGDPAGPHTVASLARLARVSPRHLARLFRQETGLTPSQFVEVSRVEAAARLLLAGASVTGAARGSGFGSDETLRRAFVRRVGLTPGAYRARFATTR
ncbi:AraC family transcriptional regulator [Virgisporangium aliadipatigenens]|uniref:AraC family transcriptional regulator n=1 Tax=Virgisporangium aliadipatigenens TaxID=741659 RepID=A0A8J4DNA3_9ACTN|nr:DJ-1/PfpI family protein [Virgisporangium aliadipatigenens]GIJ43616.1 AraC family transcriptional regulator [Virgisporangium aliadipatigenens]